jgi:hypothetical protein
MVNTFMGASGAHKKELIRDRRELRQLNVSY